MQAGAQGRRLGKRERAAFPVRSARPADSGHAALAEPRADPNSAPHTDLTPRDLAAFSALSIAEGSPMIDMRVNDLELSALVDSGAQITIFRRGK